jgi:energy-coupling factor transporter ATP-binding protein EcfA2
VSEVIFITGPSGAGKSTTTGHLAETLAGTWALVSQDGIRTLVKAGYKDPDVPWTDATRKQWEVSISICCDMVKRYYQVGIHCVVEIFAPPEEFGKWRQGLTGVPYKLFVLLPDLEETVRRNANREIPMPEASIRENHAWFTQWQPGEATIIDTTNCSLEESVNEIKSQLGRLPR